MFCVLEKHWFVTPLSKAQHAERNAHACFLHSSVCLHWLLLWGSKILCYCWVLLSLVRASSWQLLQMIYIVLIMIFVITEKRIFCMLLSCSFIHSEQLHVFFLIVGYICLHVERLRKGVWLYQIMLCSEDHRRFQGAFVTSNFPREKSVRMRMMRCPAFCSLMHPVAQQSPAASPDFHPNEFLCFGVWWGKKHIVLATRFLLIWVLAK